MLLGLVWSEKEHIWKYFDDDRQVINVANEQEFIESNHYLFQPYILFYTVQKQVQSVTGFYIFDFFTFQNIFNNLISNTS